MAMLASTVGLVVGASCLLDRSAGFEETSGSGAGDVGGMGGGEPMPECVKPEDCGGTTDCTESVDCVEGSCSYGYAIKGTACTGTLPDQRVCDGKGNCVPCATNVDCEAGGTCEMGVQSGGFECVGGLCNKLGGSIDCAPYECNEAGTVCLGVCTDDEDCSGNNVCEPSDGSCAPPRPLGTACTVNSACDSLFCRDEVCCDTDCNTQCEGCSAALTGGTDGTCDVIELGTDDPDMSCTLGFGCEGDGTCIECAEPTAALMGGNCPAACDSCSGGNTCNFACTTAAPCTTVACPAGWDCDVDCGSDDACNAATIACPPGRSCTVTCANNAGSCANAAVTCGDGPCKVDCKNGSNGNCTGTNVTCGANECDIHCSTTGEPAYTQGAACNVKTDNEC